MLLAHSIFLNSLSSKKELILRAAGYILMQYKQVW